MRTTSLVRLLAVAALSWFVLLPAPAAAFPSIGPCSLTLISKDQSGEVLDTVSSGDETASAEDPFLMDWDGTVGWDAKVAAPLQDYHYEVDMFGIPTPLRGGSANTSDTRSSTGAFAFTGSAAFRFTGLYYLTARVSGSGAECEGELVVKLIGDPLGTIPFFVGLSLVAIGVLLAAWGWKGHLVAGLFGGAFAGLGVAIALTIYSILPLGGLTPATVTIAGIVLGFASAGGGRVRLAIVGRPVPAGAQVAPEPSQHGPEAAASAVPTAAVVPAPPAAPAGPSSAPPALARAPDAPPVEPEPPVAAPPTGPGADPA